VERPVTPRDRNIKRAWRIYNFYRLLSWWLVSSFWQRWSDTKTVERRVEKTGKDLTSGQLYSWCGGLLPWWQVLGFWWQWLCRKTLDRLIIKKWGKIR
jgi:hypothetical protein